MGSSTLEYVNEFCEYFNYTKSVNIGIFCIYMKIFPSIHQFITGECDLQKLGTNT